MAVACEQRVRFRGAFAARRVAMHRHRAAGLRMQHVVHRAQLVSMLSARWNSVSSPSMQSYSKVS